jgi:hypothetical protein
MMVNVENLVVKLLMMVDVNAENECFAHGLMSTVV